jgi:anti-anti-sigma regulatory factor
MMKMQVRRIGSVHVIDFRGEVAGPWAMRARMSLNQLLTDQRVRNVLVNLRDLDTVDSLGVKAIVEPLGTQEKCGIVAGRSSVMEMFEHVNLPPKVRIFKKDSDVLSYFGEEFVENSQPLTEEQRKFPRIKTALPLEFTWTDEANRPIDFQSIVTDLSEGGLFAEYLDLAEAEMVGQTIDPYDFKMLDLKIKLPSVGWIHAKGKVVRTTWDEQIGLGIEFYHLEEEDKKKIRDFLK